MAVSSLLSPHGGTCPDLWVLWFMAKAMAGIKARWVVWKCRHEDAESFMAKHEGIEDYSTISELKDLIEDINVKLSALAKAYFNIKL